MQYISLYSAQGGIITLLSLMHMQMRFHQAELGKVIGGIGTKILVIFSARVGNYLCNYENTRR